MTSWPRSAALALVLCALPVAIVLLVWPRVFYGTPAGLGELVGARCAGRIGVPCRVETIPLSPGRYWLGASSPQADGLTLDLRLPCSETSPRFLLLGAGSVGLSTTVHVRGSTGEWIRVDREAMGGGTQRRRLVQVEVQGEARHARIALSRAPDPNGAPGRLRLGEIGLFSSDHGLLEDSRWLFPGLPDRYFYNGILTRACVALAGLGVLVAFLLPTSVGRRFGPVFVFFITLSTVAIEVWLVNTPYWHLGRDLRVAMASGPLQERVGANLNYGMHLGARLLEGHGLTFGPGWVPWARMPGYGLFNAAAGILAGFRTDLLTLGVSSIQLHLLLLALANAVFVAAASRLAHTGTAVAVAVALCFMPNQLHFTQVDSIMVSVYLLTAAALCSFLSQRRREAMPPLRYHLAVHLSFALWFLMRTDGAVGWAAVSLILYWRVWRHLALPIVLFLLIGIPWGAYKLRYTGEFSMTTFSVGDSAWVGLWQVPHKFKWKPADESYFGWAEHVGVPPTSKRASDAAVREVLRFSATYPVYVTHLMLHKFLRFVDPNAFNGVLEFPRVRYEVLRGPPLWGLLAVIALCFAIGYERHRTLLLAWPLLFNLPLFCLFFTDHGRHVAPVSASILVSALPPLLEAGFYRSAWRRRGIALGVGGAFLAVWFLAHGIDNALLASDGWRYSTPLLDPSPFFWYLP